MALSGVTLASEVAGAVNEVRMKKARFVILTIGADGKQISVKETGARNATYDDFVGKLKADEPVYAAYDFEWEDAGVTRSKPLLIMWVPDTAKPRAKMIYSASRDVLNSVTDGFTAVQANDSSEVSKAELQGRATGGRR